MPSDLPFGSRTLVIPFTFVPHRRPERRPGAPTTGMSWMEPVSFRHGVEPLEGRPDDPRRSIAPVPRQPPVRRVSDRVATDQALVRKDGPSAAPSDPAPSAEPEHGAIWHWMHRQGLVETRHERADGLRRVFGSRSGEVWSQNDAPLDVDRMSDDEVLEFARQLGMLAALGVRPGKQPPASTSWGWRDQAPYNAAVNQLKTPGTHNTVNGRVPTREEAIELINRAGGQVERIEEGHGPNSRSTHHQPRINYYTPSGKKATVIVQPWQ